MKYQFPKFTDKLGQEYPAQQVTLREMYHAEIIRPLKKYLPVPFEVPPTMVTLQPPEGANYPACEVYAPARFYRYFPTVEDGQTMPANYSRHVDRLADYLYNDLKRLDFVFWGSIPEQSHLELEAVEAAQGNFPETLKRKDGGGPLDGPVAYGYRGASGGSLRKSGEQVSPGFGGTMKGLKLPPPPPKPAMIRVPDTQEDHRSLPLRPFDAERLKGLLAEKKPFALASELFEGALDQLKRPVSAEEYYWRYQGNDGSCRNNEGKVEDGEWHLALVPPHKYSSRKIIDHNGKLTTRFQMKEEDERVLRVFIPYRYIDEPIYRPFTFQIPPNPAMAEFPDEPLMQPANIVQMPDVWARLWYPPRIHQKVIPAWYGNVLAEENQRVELVSVYKPKELAVTNDYQPDYLPGWVAETDPVPPPPVPDLAEVQKIAPRKEMGLPFAALDSALNGTWYRIRFAPFMYWDEPEVNGLKYPKQLIVVQYPHKDHFIKKTAVARERKISIKSDSIQVKVRGTFEKSERPVGPDGQKIKGYPDTTITVEGVLYDYFIPVDKSADLLSGDPLLLARATGAHDRTQMKELMFEEVRPQVYDSGEEDKVNSRRGRWFKLTFPLYGQVIHPGFVDSKGRKFDQFPVQKVVIDIQPQIIRIPLTMKYMAWKIYPEDMKIMLLDKANKPVEVDFSPNSFDFYPKADKNNRQRFANGLDQYMSTKSAFVRLIMDRGLGNQGLPDPRISDIEPEMGLLGALEPGQEEPYPPILGTNWHSVPGYPPMPCAPEHLPTIEEEQDEFSDDSDGQKNKRGGQGSMHATRHNLAELGFDSESEGESEPAEKRRGRSRSAPAGARDQPRNVWDASHSSSPPRRRR
ncbi:hypothetical protein HDE_04973 [Halotydeus destructor]|nr:hypothetical protein HDE_04973 [Halotydeus destructor]